MSCFIRYQLLRYITKKSIAILSGLLKFWDRKKVNTKKFGTAVAGWLTYPTAWCEFEKVGDPILHSQPSLSMCQHIFLATLHNKDKILHVNTNKHISRWPSFPFASRSACASSPDPRPNGLIRPDINGSVTAKTTGYTIRLLWA